MSMTINFKDEANDVVDTHFTVKCPHCAVPSGLSAISIPRYKLLQRYKPRHTGVTYQCDACGEPVFLRFPVRHDYGNYKVYLDDTKYEEIQRPQENYEFKYLPDDVAADFREALNCYAQSCFNAFAAMCRRSLQAAATDLGAKGKDKVQKQIEDLKNMAEIDGETFEVLQTIILAGHDGAHPHLPPLSSDRAEILLELIKDVLYQLFVRKKKIEEASQKRNEAIQKKAR